MSACYNGYNDDFLDEDGNVVHIDYEEIDRCYDRLKESIEKTHINRFQDSVTEKFDEWKKTEDFAEHINELGEIIESINETV